MDGIDDELSCGARGRPQTLQYVSSDVIAWPFMQVSCRMAGRGDDHIASPTTPDWYVAATPAWSAGSTPTLLAPTGSPESDVWLLCGPVVSGGAKTGEP
jgi:hypothetical protein